eukprot:TRINITY_DN2214_c0_g1_i3.p1 TRINITY_DN2214_c0_g1~~TRINITY_DN2214_c0_g1_i3.p1  ORF type:complete len:535 (-),score=134.61 TRINITY_DN2214_c0_g1_i3:1649-3253(-)
MLFVSFGATKLCGWRAFRWMNRGSKRFAAHTTKSQQDERALKRFIWKDPLTHKQFIEGDLARDLNIRQWEDWYEVKKSDFYRLGGGSLLRKYYRNSPALAISSTFPQYPWDLDRFRNKTWKEPAERREFMDKVMGKHLKIQNWEDWYKVSAEDFLECGGRGLLNSYYGGSPWKAVVDIYPEYEWNLDKFTRGNIWGDPKVRREFMEKALAKILVIKNWTDWYHVKKEDFHKNQGGGLLRHYYGDSVAKAVTSIFPEHPWQLHRFGNWKDVASHRDFMDNTLAKALNVTTYEDWYRVKHDDFRKFGGGNLLETYYSNSKSLALMSIYPEYKWDPHRFARFELPSDYWDSATTRKFYEDLLRANNWNVDKLKEISRATLESETNGKDMLSVHGDSVLKSLRSAFPEITWEEPQFDYQTKAQRLVFDILRANVPSDTQILVNYKHPKLLHEGSSQAMELDLYIPKLNLAVEYQGKHHFEQIKGSEQIRRQIERDEEKMRACENNGIDLVVIPYWWNSSESQLFATIRKKRPDLFVSN